MKYTVITEELKTPVLGEYDVIVCGGGIGGLAAAVAASRHGSSVLLLEKSILLGGLATYGLISWFEPICDGRGSKLMYGMADELLQLAIKYSADTLPDEWRSNTKIKNTSKRCATHYSPTIFTLALDQWTAEAGVDILLDTVVVSSVLKENRCNGVIVENKTGRACYKANMFIDATGDADLLYRSGVPCIEGKNYLTYIAYMTDFEKAQKALDAQNILNSRSWYKVGSDLWGKGHPDDMPVLAGTSAKEVTDFVLAGRKMLFDNIRQQDKWERDITILPGMAQFRTTRRIEGNYTLVESDEGKGFEDSIGVASDFAHKGKAYELPYRILYNKDFDNLLTAGRSVSSSGWAWEVTRVIPVAAATGQAAGTAASICAKYKIALKDIKLGELQKELIKNKAKIKL